MKLLAALLEVSIERSAVYKAHTLGYDTANFVLNFRYKFIITLTTAPVTTSDFCFRALNAKNPFQPCSDNQYNKFQQ